MINVEGGPVCRLSRAVVCALQLICVANHVHGQAQDHKRDQPYYDPGVGQHISGLLPICLPEHELSSSLAASGFTKLKIQPPLSFNRFTNVSNYRDGSMQIRGSPLDTEDLLKCIYAIMLNPVDMKMGVTRTRSSRLKRGRVCSRIEDSGGIRVHLLAGNLGQTRF